MPVVDVTTLQPGQRISFTSKEPHDEVTYYGAIEAVGGYSMTTRYGVDIVSRYQAMRKLYPDLAPMDELYYITIQMYQEGKVGYHVIARDWIEPSSIQIIEQESYFDVRVYMIPDDKLTDVLDLLKSHDIPCSQTPKKIT